MSETHEHGRAGRTEWHPKGPAWWSVNLYGANGALLELGRAVRRDVAATPSERSAVGLGLLSRRSAELIRG